ncbi:hypothetical protein F4809DRAFT_637439 [Biscogniauxia mediterranea]|nr:hypothetical protein F4809DRAFT_637439 [Biscogniauxia mediterranea]
MSQQGGAVSSMREVPDSPSAGQRSLDNPTHKEENPFGEKDEEIEDDFTDISSVEVAKNKGEKAATGRKTRQDKRDLLLEGFDNLGTDFLGQKLADVVSVLPDLLLQMGERAKAKITREQMTIKEYLTDVRLVPYGDSWTQDDEDRLSRRLNDDPYYRYIQHLRAPSTNNEFLPMWKKICKVLKVAPTDIVGPTKHLAYGGKTVNVGKTASVSRDTWPDPNWSTAFCSGLARVALGGPCGKDVRLLALFLRYAVACRLNDRRPFLMLGVNWDKFLELAEDKLERNRNPSVSIAQAHKEVREIIRSREVPLPWYSDVMRNLEKLVYKPNTPPLQQPGEPVEYMLQTEDLTNLEKAFNGCKVNGRSLFTSVEIGWSMASHQRSDWPEDSNDLMNLRAALYKRDQRLIEIRGRETDRASMSGVGDEDDNDDDDDGDEHEDLGYDEPLPSRGDGESLPLPGHPSLTRGPTLVAPIRLSSRLDEVPYHTEIDRSFDLPPSAGVSQCLNSGLKTAFVNAISMSLEEAVLLDEE